jgi:hypothetical protein
MRLLYPNISDSIFQCSPNTNKPQLNFDTNLDSKLNEAQKLVVSEASSIIDYSKTEPKFYFIQGPPGKYEVAIIIKHLMLFNPLKFERYR